MRMNIKVTALSVVAALVVATGLLVVQRGSHDGQTMLGVVPPPTAPVPVLAYTKDWFLSHPDRLKVVYPKCEDDPNGFGASDECIDAEDAYAEQYGNNMWTKAASTSVTVVDPSLKVTDVSPGGTHP
jgi:hypothetical protein